MSESVHAVVAKPHHEHNHHISSAVPRTQVNGNSVDNAATDDEDDDIAIISKFDHNNQEMPSSSVGSNHYLPSPTATQFNTFSNYRLGSENQPTTLNTNPPTRSSLFEPSTLAPLAHTHGRPSQDWNSSTIKPEDQRASSRTGHQQETQERPNEWATEDRFSPARDRLRRALRYFFMSPWEKWRIKGRFPWKLLFQLVKIILVTTQVIIFGNSITDYRIANNSMLVSLHNLFLQNWDTSRDFKVVPPESGPYAVYTKDDVYQHVDYAVKNYANVSALTVGAFGYQSSRETNSAGTLLNIEACFHRYANATLNPSLGEYFIDAAITEQCITIDYPYPPGSEEWANFSFAKFLQDRYPLQKNLDSLLQMNVKLPLRTIILNSIERFNSPQCFDLDVSINFDNRAHTGEMLISMPYHNKQIDCKGNLEDHSRETHSNNVHIAINFIVLFLCFFSLILCIRSLWRSQTLRRRTARFFALAYRRNLETQSALHFIDGWILMILLNDCLLITGTTFNLLRQMNIVGPRTFSLRPIDFDNLCAALLGVGNLLVWGGILRYLAFFSKYNILIVTLKHALPRVLRFLLCVLVLYGGFCFSGWIILGPYHWKFQTLARTSECLFALMNGDDVFATFAYLQNSSPFVWWFSRAYLYTFVLLFIYIVLSLFIAILMDSYETIKDHYASRNKRKLKGMLLTNDQLGRFIGSCEDEDEADCWSSYRMSLLHDEEMEYQAASFRNEDAPAPPCHCCMCHCLSHLSSPLTCFRSAFASFRDKLRRAPQNRAEDRDNLIN